MRRSHHATSLRQALPALLFVAIAGIAGVKVLGLSHAATYSSNPIGFADYCQIENSHTVLYGWAYDPESVISDQPYVTVIVGTTGSAIPSNISTYRVAAINSWLDGNYPGAPQMGTYGWRLELSGLYKGNSYAVSGTVINAGAGTNTALQVNTDDDFSNEAIGQKPIFTATKKVPDACLVAAPGSAPAPTPAPSPTPTPSPKPTPAPAPSPKPNPTPTPPPSPTASAPFSSKADATVSTGTTSAALTIPAAGASKVHVVYTKQGGVSIASSSQSVSGSSTTVQLSNLAAKTTYTYQIVRTNNAGTVATSPAATFVTEGYTLTLQLLDGHGKPISGIKGTLSNSSHSTGTSDGDGRIVFRGLPSSTYTLTYSYAGHDSTHEIDVSSGKQPQFDANNSPAVIALSDTINVANSSVAKQSPQSSSQLIALLGIASTAIIATIIWLFIRQRKEEQLHTEVKALSKIEASAAQPLVVEPPKQPTIIEPLPDHAGESLRDMVIHSMYSPGAQQPQSQLDHELTVAERSALLPPQPVSDPTPKPATEEPIPQTKADPEPPERKAPARTQHRKQTAKPTDSGVLRIDHHKK